jgi:long-chain acyl-CoA synthetase
MAESVYSLFKSTVSSRGDQVAAQYKVAGAWRDVTWKEMDGVADRCSAALVSAGVPASERIAILSNTRPEWALADLGILGAGCTTVPIYQSNLDHECAYILNDSGAVFVFAEDKDQLEKLRAVRDEIPKVKKVVCFTSEDVDTDSDWEQSWEDFLAEGEAYLKDNEADVRARADELSTDSILTFIYTSGTTGKPKGTVLTHDNMMYEAEALTKLGFITPDDIMYLFLPLAHVFAKVVEVNWFSAGHVMAFWEGDQAKIVDNLGEVRPTMMPSVPRIFEKVHAKVTGDMKNAGGIAGVLSRWALKKGEEAAALERAGKQPGGIGWSLANQLVWSKVQAKLAERFGGRLRFFISGGAPLSPDIAYFFKYAGVKICEGYGLTETSAGAFINRPDDIRIGTVGTAMPGTECKIAKDGEILLRGRLIMREYWNREDATKEVIGDQGWFHTGDIGELSSDGFLRITDRKKDIIVTAGGKNVAPQNIENSIKSRSPLISQVVVHGDKRKFLSAVVTLDADNLKAWGKGKGLSDDHAALSKNAEVRKEVENVIETVNSGLARYETLKKFEILDHDFEIGDQLTPTLKVKRKLCNERYKDIFDGFYGDS